MAKFGEAERAESGRSGPALYMEDLIAVKEERYADSTAPKIIKAHEGVWEDTPHGRIKHLAHPKLNSRVKDIEAYMQVIPPDGRTGKHRHMAEEFMFILEGRGYSLHWDVDLDMGEKYGWKVAANPQRFDWEEGDWVFVPVNTVHQHFNLESDRPARFISAWSRIYKLLGWHDLEQIENAPEWAEAQ